MPIKIFISHSSRDKKLARCLVEAIETKTTIRSDEIRCTSVKGYRLGTGTTIATQLRKEISDAGVIIGLVTPNGLRSTYVLFELGAAWGLRKPTFPLLAKGAHKGDLVDPLKEKHAISITNASNVRKVIYDLQRVARLSSRRDSNPEKFDVKVEEVVKAAKPAPKKTKAKK